MARILIADDNLPNAELLEAHLGDGAFETRISTNGDEALKMAKEWNADIVLLDVMMPRLSGFEVCKRLRADAATKQVGIIMVTALDQGTDIERAVEAGTDDFITKPINKTELVLRVRALLDSKGQTEALPRRLEYFRRVQSVNAPA